MLWTDADFITADDLTTLDAEVAEVAAAESIVLQDTAGNSIIHRATEEVGDRLMKYLQVFGGYLGNGSVSANHTAAVFNIGTPAINRTKIVLGQVAVTGLNSHVWTALKRWAAYWTLHVFYRDAANRTLRDRYVDKEQRYRKEADTIHWDAVRSAGVPVVSQPLPCPGALWEPAAGPWGLGNVSIVAGTGTVEASYDVAVSYVDGTQTNNGESATSARVTVDLTANKVISVDISSLTPPNGKQHPGTVPFAVVQYLSASAWNVYAGVTGGPLYLQNTLPIATKTFTLPGDPVLSGVIAGPGQWPDRYVSLPMGILQRG